MIVYIIEFPIEAQVVILVIELISHKALSIKFDVLPHVHSIFYPRSRAVNDESDTALQPHHASPTAFHFMPLSLSRSRLFPSRCRCILTCLRAVAIPAVIDLVSLLYCLSRARMLKTTFGTVRVMT